MTCADRLLELHDNGVNPDSAAVMDALPEIAAAIAAAETYIGALNDYGMADDGPLADSLAALAARMEGDKP